MKNSQEGMIIFRQVETLTIIIEKYLKPQVQSLTAKTFILSLEES